MRAPRASRPLHALRTVGVLAVAGLALAACGQSTPAPAESPAAASAEVEVFTWWASGSEKLGLDVLVAQFAAQHPQYTFVNGAVAGGAGSAAKDVLQSRMRGGTPPDTFQVHAGAELSDYIAAGQVQDLSVLYDELDLHDAFPAALIEELTVDGKLYSVPSNVHRANVVWASTSVLESAGLDPDATYPTLGAWFTALDQVRSTGRTPLAVGTTWTQVHLLETVLLSDLGADGYAGLWDGTTDWSGPAVTEALTDFARLLSYTDADRDSLDWSDATRRVIDGKAGFTVMGDWALAAFQDAGQVAGTDFVDFTVPGTDGVFDFLADSFTLPTGAPNPDGARAWLSTVGSLAGQTAFSLAKGSIPARVDVPSDPFDAYQQAAMASFATDQIVPSLAHGAAAPDAVLSAVTAATRDFTTGVSDLAGFQAALVRATGT